MLSPRQRESEDAVNFDEVLTGLLEPFTSKRDDGFSFASSEVELKARRGSLLPKDRQATDDVPKEHDGRARREQEDLIVEVVVALLVFILEPARIWPREDPALAHRDGAEEPLGVHAGPRAA